MIQQKVVAIFSDLHLGVYGNSENWHDTALKWADWISNDLKNRKIKDIFFLGDFFDNRTEISVQTIHIASKILEKFTDFNLFMIVGNHDAYYKNRSDVHSLGMVKGHKNITLIDKNLEFSAFGKDFLFVPWNNELPDKEFDYIFGHFEIQTFKMNNFVVCQHGLTPSSLLKGKTKAVFSGHFHNRNSKKYKEGDIHYVGSCFSMDFSDVGNAKGYHLLNVDDLSIEFIENKVSPKFIKFNLSDIKSVDLNSLSNNIVKIIIDKEIEDEKLTKLTNAIKKYNLWRLDIDFNVTSKTLNDIEQIDSIDIKEMFNEFYNQLGIDENQLKRVKEINIKLYENNLDA